METLEWNLLLSVLSLPGVFLGAAVVKYTGRRNLLMMGFSGYIVFGLIVGISFDKIIKVIPAFIIMCKLDLHCEGLALRSQTASCRAAETLGRAM